MVDSIQAQYWRLSMIGGIYSYALSFRSGQRHSVELESASQVTKLIGTKKHIIVSCI
jgi:7-cyano-7-deazaguanine synthase in queuosine biosynthesis